MDLDLGTATPVLVGYMTENKWFSFQNSIYAQNGFVSGTKFMNPINTVYQQIMVPAGEYVL